MNVYINLPVSDLARSRRFYEALGFSFNEQFSNHEALAVVINDKAGIMLLTPEKFSQFTPRPIADAASASQTLLALSLDDRAAVDAMIAKALSNGGEEVRETEDLGFMYQRAFADPDGHIFEPFHMDLAAMTSEEAA